MKNRNLFFTVLQTEKSKIKVLTDLVSGESTLPRQLFFYLRRNRRGKIAF